MLFQADILYYPLFKRSLDVITFRLHGMDLFGVKEDSLDKRFYTHPGMKSSLSMKLGKFNYIFEHLSKNFEFSTVESFVREHNLFNSKE